MRLGIVHDHDAASGLERPEADLAKDVANLVDPDRAAVAGLDRRDVGMHATRDSAAGRAERRRRHRRRRCHRRTAALMQLSAGQCHRINACRRQPGPRRSGRAAVFRARWRADAGRESNDDRECRETAWTANAGSDPSTRLFGLWWVRLALVGLLALAEKARPEPALLLWLFLGLRGQRGRRLAGDGGHDRC